MNKIFQKLCSRAGETLVEAMAAILVFTLASILLFTMVNAANNINREALESDAAISEELNYAEKKAQGTETDKGQIVIKIGNQSPKSYSVNIFRASENAVFSYSLAK